ncbi:MAG TPA: family 1 glycosylhydrolase [Anaeromyxobacter sp.]|nr:family 1 glycosylhydrolase [Anaeromyxobacter sp.]
MILGIVLAALLAAYAAGWLWFAAREGSPASFTPADLAAPVGTALPEGFLWGTATAAYQVEGGSEGEDWWAFEQEPGRIARGERSGRAADAWNRVAEDVELMRRLGANAYRFSIGWSRVEPAAGRFDGAAWEHYADEAQRLRGAGIEPLVTLHHFTVPRWLAGGVLDPGFPAGLARLAREAARRLGGDVRLFCTINEPNVLMFKSFVEGSWPPAERDPERAVAALANLLRAHAFAAAALREVLPEARVGVANHLRVFDPARRSNLLDWVAARATALAFNWAFYDSIAAGRLRFTVPGFPKLDEPFAELKGSADWFGLNYYTRDLVRFAPGAPGNIERVVGPGPKTDLGWEIYPEGLLRLLRAAHARYRLPIHVTENGIADARGTLRPTYLRAHAHALAEAAREGVPVLGYFHWSLLDNFEWEQGFEPRFGLYRVDPKTFERSPASGADVFAALAAERREP